MKAPLGYVAIHKDKILPAASAYYQSVLKAIMEKQRVMMDNEISGWPWAPKTRVQAEKKLDSEPGQWRALKWDIKIAQQEFCQLQTACLMSEGHVYLDIAVMHKLFEDM